MVMLSTLVTFSAYLRHKNLDNQSACGQANNLNQISHETGTEIQHL